MRRVVVINNVTLDGVIQARGRPDEDTRGGFKHGGWAVMPNSDPVIDLQIMGSGELVQSLMARDLIDEYMLLIHPLVLGSGRRLFADGGAVASLRLVDGANTTSTGVVIATYESVRE